MSEDRNNKWGQVAKSKGTGDGSLFHLHLPKPLFYKAFLSMTRDGFVVKKEKKRGTGKLIII